MRELLRSARVFLVSLTLVSLTNASIYTLQNKNSTVQIDSLLGAGMFSWTVDGVDQFYKNSQTTGTQWFWYRVGDQTQEYSLENLSLVNAEASNKSLFLTYQDTARNFTIEVDYVLNGGQNGSRSSHIIETVSISNESQENLDLHFFQYTDLDLNATPNEDFAVHTNDNSIQQTDQSHFSNETVATSAPQHWEITPWSATIDKLHDGLATTLSDTSSLLGPTDVAWAFQWDQVVAPGGTFQISEGMHIIEAPEPATLSMLFLGSLAFLCRRK
jgi:hypothetical protein